MRMWLDSNICDCNAAQKTVKHITFGCTIISYPGHLDDFVQDTEYFVDCMAKSERNYCIIDMMLYLYYIHFVLLCSMITLSYQKVCRPSRAMR